jgi:hypothetical protein
MSELSVGQLRGLTINDNVITVPSGHTLYAPGTVVQVVNNSYAVQTSTTSTSFQNTGLSATITPLSASSKILVLTNHHIYKGLQNTNNGVIIEILRDSTQVSVSGMMLYTGNAIDNTGASFLQVLDSPNTTSPIAYSTRFRNNAAATQVIVNYGGSPSNITLMEIAT